MNDLLEFLRLLQIPYQLINKNQKISIPLPIKENTDLNQQNNYLIYYRKIVFYGYLPLNDQQILFIGPLTSHRVYGMETFEIFFCYNSSKRYRRLKDILSREPLTNFKTFKALLTKIIKDFHLPIQKLQIKELQKNPQQTDNFIQLPNDDIQKDVISAIRVGNIDQIYSILNNPAVYTNSAIVTKNPPKRDLQYFYFSTISKINEIAAQAGVPHEIRDQFSARYTKLWDDPTLDAIKIGHLLVDAMIDTAEECRNNIYFKTDDPLLNQVLHFVSHHVNQKISREQIAAALNLSPSYLSHQFKSKAKMTISHFINLFKVNQAKYLLATTNLSVLDISESLAFSNVTYFNRIFNKITGQTPSKFRKDIDKKSGFPL